MRAAVPRRSLDARFGPAVVRSTTSDALAFRNHVRLANGTGTRSTLPASTGRDSTPAQGVAATFALDASPRSIGGGIGPMRTAQLPQAVGRSSGPAAAAGSSGVETATPAPAASNAGNAPAPFAASGIRPLTLAPSAVPDGAQYTVADASGGSGGSGGETPKRTDANPVVTFSGGGMNSPYGSGAGSVEIKQTVSVGQVFTVNVSPAKDEISTLESVTIKGMSDISSYHVGLGPDALFMLDPDADAPLTVGLDRNVVTSPTPDQTGRLASTRFIVDAMPRTYTVTITANYKNGDKGTTTATFTSKRPEGTLQKVDQGQTEANSGGHNGQLVYYNNNPKNKYGMKDGIIIQADTSPISGVDKNGAAQIIPGTFMVMQTSDTWNWSYTTTDGKIHGIMRGATGGGLLDNGIRPTELPPSLGYHVEDLNAPVVSGQDPPEILGWTLPVPNGNPPVTTGRHLFTDPPAAGAPEGVDLHTVTSVTVGTPGGNLPDPGSTPDKYTTYLMYKVDGGVWVALSKVEWDWGGHAPMMDEPVFGGRTLNPAPLENTRSGVPASVTPSLGDSKDNQADAFPTWNGTTYATYDDGWEVEN